MEKLLPLVSDSVNDVVICDLKAQDAMLPFERDDYINIKGLDNNLLKLPA